jgi:Flp pilus assembly pilin Flp
VDVAHFWGKLRRLAADRRAFTALEYTLITVIIGTVVLAGVDIIGNALNTSYGHIGNALAAEAAGM